MQIPYNRFGANKPAKPAWHRYILWLLLGATTISIAAGIKLFFVLFGANIVLHNDSDRHLYIRQGTTLDQLVDEMKNRHILVHPGEFRWVARQKDLGAYIKPGHYELTPGMNNIRLVMNLATGHQTPVRVIFNNIRTIPQLAGRLAKQLEADSAALLKTFSDTLLLRKAGFTEATLPAIFIPNTYEMYWTIPPADMFRRMLHEYHVFWDSARMALCRADGLTPVGVVTLASIVEQETNKNSEKSRIAGVYINRLHSGMPLQADPTVKFALGDFGLKRIRHEHTETDSPYNTYKYAGLPPGPICLPSIASVEAVLNYERHGYYYFCAKDDLSGYHEFSRSYDEHMQNARRYQKALNRMNIN